MMLLRRGVVHLARDVVLAFQVTRPMTGMDLLTSNNKGEDGYFILTLTAGKELEKMQTGADYVFILNITGSMANKDKLETSVHSLESFIKNLGPDDRFEVIMTTFTVILFSIDDAGSSLQYDWIAIALGELWRIITGHLVHWSFDHFLWCVITFVALGPYANGRAGRALLFL